MRHFCEFIPSYSHRYNSHFKWVQWAKKNVCFMWLLICVPNTVSLSDRKVNSSFPGRSGGETDLGLEGKQGRTALRKWVWYQEREIAQNTGRGGEAMGGSAGVQRCPPPCIQSIYSPHRHTMSAMICLLWVLWLMSPPPPRGPRRALGSGTTEQGSSMGGVSTQESWRLES